MQIIIPVWDDFICDLKYSDETFVIICGSLYYDERDVFFLVYVCSKNDLDLILSKKYELLSRNYASYLII